MRMRQSVAQFERAFRQESVEDRDRRERLRREAVQRTRARRQEKARQRGDLRFVLLVLSIIGTTVLVTIVMFETLARLMG